MFNFEILISFPIKFNSTSNLTKLERTYFEIHPKWGRINCKTDNTPGKKSRVFFEIKSFKKTKMINNT